MTYQPYPPQPPRPRKKTLGVPAIVGISVGAVLLSCCGVGAIGAALDPPEKPSAQTSTSPVAGEQFRASPDIMPLYDASPSPSPSPSPVKRTSPPPKPKPVSYSSCTAVRAAGKAPLLKGQPGYRTALDRDGDGRACEANEGPKPGSGGDSGGGDSGGSNSGGGVYYANCAAVRAAGAAPIRRGDPGYSRKLDRDGDGVACE